MGDEARPSRLRSCTPVSRSAIRREVLHRGHQHAYLLPADLSGPIAQGRKHPLLRDSRGRTGLGLPTVSSLPAGSVARNAGLVGTSSVVSRGLRLITEGALDRNGVDALADRLGVTARHLRRLFLQHLGATPIEVALTRCVHFAKKLIDETHLPFSQVAFASGFGSLRRFNGEIRRVSSRTPSQLRRLARRRPVEHAGYQFRIAYRPPYDWKAVIGSLRSRATPGVERVDEDLYLRTIAIDGKCGTIAVSPAADGPTLILDADFSDSRALLLIVERVRRMFDVAADPAVIAEQLSGEVLLKHCLVAHPGIRTPGAWDPFELTVRAILGQQISVAAATTIAGRVAAGWGTPIEYANGLTHLFPTAAQLRSAPLEETGIISSRAATLRAVAKAVCDGTLVFDGTATAGQLRAITGVGDWTTQYVLMRALNDPDAFQCGDLVLKRMAGGCTSQELDRLSEPWRPWRAYAVMLLWQSARDLDEHQRRSRHAHVDLPLHRRRPRDRGLAGAGVR